MALLAGTKNDYAHTMAEAMENAFLKEWPNIMTATHPVPEMTDQMRLLFIAVAQGVVRHLVNNATSFQVTINGPVSGYSGSVSIDHDGTLY